MILPRKTKAAVNAAQIANPSVSAAQGNRFVGTVRPAAALPFPGSEVGRDCTSEAVSTRFDAPGAVAWGTMSWRKQVGQAIGEPLLPEAHVMCWPQTGQANLISLMIKTTHANESNKQ